MVLISQFVIKMRFRVTRVLTMKATVRIVNDYSHMFVFFLTKKVSKLLP